MMQKLTVFSAIFLSTAAGLCVDDPFFLSSTGQPCSIYNGTNCSSFWSNNIPDLLEYCPAACASCVKASDFCEIGLGGDVLDVGLTMNSFDLIDQPFLSQACEWQDSPQGLMQTSYAWGNFPGENVSLPFFLLRRQVVLLKSSRRRPRRRQREKKCLSFSRMRA